MAEGGNVVDPQRINLRFREEAVDTIDEGPAFSFSGQSAPRLVIAIDFGTYASGYALQWRSDFTNDRLKIHCNTKWTSGGFCTYKTPTCLLLKPDESIAEFGYQAESKFSMLGAEDENEKPEDWYFFRHFKMMLYHRENVGDDTPVEAAHGKHLPVIEVFSKSIEYMKDHVIDHLRQNGITYPEAETKWVITVPAIWNDPAKHVMRRAAEKAGIIGTNLSIALEPECAAIYCSQLPVNQLEIQGDSGKLKYVAAPDSTIMVVDLGGGTVDITTVQINKDSTMKQVYMSGGGPWGGMKVDEQFMMLLRNIVGPEVMQKFVQDNPMDEYDLRMDFESRKREVKHFSEPNSNERFRIKLPQTLKDLWEKTEEKKVVDILKSKEKLKNIKFMNGRLSFHPDVIRAFFQETVEGILNYIAEVMKNPEHDGITIDSLILVGGFAESNFVVQSLREGLKDRGVPVVRPQSTELAVLNGAVLFGQNEEILTSRIMRYTYGVAMIMEYDKQKHKKEEVFESDGKEWANNVFRKHVTKGQEVKLCQWVSDKEYYPADEEQKSATVLIFSSDKKDPIHTTESGCKCIGSLEVEFPDASSPGKEGRPRSRRAVEVAMSFGGTELKVKAISKTLGKVYKKSLRLQ
ncbi:heat shock 70 kDa protein 12B-like [Mercenaria mercenaria]|uniref:heat shock 70 kDa protein 12B-like n=1 Tax=Mercenaria mercenaria TaxID=6596 RepID=UPI00234F2E61|nr:heat shock 70 kDa protein 12B-like [Mercenaria mercenaria]XP_045166463.2 heat shock 70 kDa protein 12B-like [Mercenaria mercenaria]